MMPKWHQNGTKMASKWHQNGTKMAPKWHQNGTKMASKLCFVVVINGGRGSQESSFEP
jgi:hypothetical protein